MLGDISGKYESGNRPGAVSSGTGDLGGVSYGAHQFIASVANAFVKWLVKQGSPYGERLAQFQAPSSQFSAVWKEIADEDPQGFLMWQHKYTEMQYYVPACRYLEVANYHINKHSEAVKEMVFSRSVQYGAYYIVELFMEALKCWNSEWLNLSYIDDKYFDKGLIEHVYEFLIQECDNAYQVSSGLYHSPHDWANGSYDVVKIGLRNRFINERNDLLELLESEV